MAVAVTGISPPGRSRRAGRVRIQQGDEGGALVVEKRLPAATVKELERRGHIVEVGPEWSEGRLTAASRDGRKRRAAANPRGMQGYAAGR